MGSRPHPSTIYDVKQQVTEDAPTYVNAKQYRRIIKRREARAKLEARRKVAPQRKVHKKCSEDLAMLAILVAKNASKQTRTNIEGRITAPFAFNTRCLLLSVAVIPAQV